MQQRITKLDFWEVIEDINQEMKRLRWTEQKGRRFLTDRYGKNSRLKLSDQQLLEFRDYLKSLPSTRIKIQPRFGGTTLEDWRYRNR